MAKYYFSEDKYNDDRAYTINHLLDYMKRHHIEKMDIFEAKRVIGSGYFYCKYYDEIGTSGESCGKKWCENYKPNNGINGRCRYYGYVYERTDVKITLEI